MLASFRRFLNTWVARAFFIVLIASFGLWGISGTVQDLTRDTALATVGDRRIEPAEFQDAFRQQMAEVTRKLGNKTEPTPQIRRLVASQTLDRLVTQAVLANEAKRLGIAVPDTALTAAVFAMPAFRGRTGAFDRTTFNAVMRQNNLTEARFLDLLRADLAQKQLLDPVQGAVVAPELPARALYAYQNETRTAEYIEFAFETAPAPPAPTADDLQRHYENNQARYSAPEFRRIKIVTLSPETLAVEVNIPDADIAAYFDTHRAELTRPERRSAEIVISPDRDGAAMLATAWIGGADWMAIQAQASAAGAAATSVDDAQPADFPAPDLGQAVFAAAPDQVVGPVQTSAGWAVLRVTKIDTSTNTTLAETEPAIRARLTRERAADLVYTRTTQLEDAIATDPTLDSIPADLGAEGASGEMDAQGNTRDGTPAPLPGPDALRPALLAAAFTQARGDPPRLTEGVEGAYWALTVTETEAPTLKPYATVAAQVQEDWEQDQRRRTQEIEAAKLLGTIKTGANLADAALIAGLRVQRSVAVPRPGAAAPPVPAELAQALFTLRPAEPTMIEVPGAYLVLTLAETAAPDLAADPAGAAQMRATLNQSLGQDVAATFAQALRQRVRPTVNRAMLDSFTQ